MNEFYPNYLPVWVVTACHKPRYLQYVIIETSKGAEAVKRARPMNASM
jgi:hypothetical protein